MSKLQIIGAIALAAGLCISCSKNAEVEPATEEAVAEVSSVDKALDIFYSKDYNETISFATDVINNEGESVEMLTIRGVAYAKADKQFLAFRDLNAAVKMEYSAYTLYNLGTALRMFGHCARAADAFQNALTLEPDNQAIIINLVSSYACYGDTASASEQFLKVVNNFPQDAIAFTSAAILKATIDENEEARTAAQKAVNLDPTYKPAYKVLEHTCQKLGDSQCANQAKAEFNKLNGQEFRTTLVKRRTKPKDQN